MIKRGYIILSVLIISILAVQPVSAGFFGDIFNKITGRVTDDIVEPVPPEPDSVPASEPEPVPPEETPTETEPVPPEPIICPTITPPVCPDETTTCPEETGEDGCPAWNCDTCETTEPIPPEDECLPIQTTMTCGAEACEGKDLGDCLCPMKKDEKGCSYWDCDSCKTPVPDNCRRIMLENGAEVTECKKECPGIPGGAIEKCKESGGNVIERKDHYGCPFIECEYDVGEQCPSAEEMEAKKQACLNQNLKPIIVRKAECDTVKCQRVEPEKRCAEDVNARKEIKEKCMESGGEIAKRFDDNGCPITVCIDSGQECSKNVPEEAYKNCEIEEGDLMIKRDAEGCIVFIDCAKRGKKEVGYENIEEMPSAGTLLAVALKLESLKIDFDKLAAKVTEIAKYYEGTGNGLEAARFRKVAELFSSAINKLDEIKIKFRENAKDMTEEDLRELKYDIKYVSEVIMQDALYIILGGEIELGGGTGVTEEGYTNCGSDGQCWREAVRLCEPVIHSPRPSDPIPLDSAITARIHGLDEDGFCMIDAEVNGYSMFCKVKDYATLNTDGPEILEFCEGNMVEWLLSGVKDAEPPKVKPGKCANRCGDGICQEKVCMGNGCPCQETFENCQKDCDGMPSKFKFCTEEDEKEFKNCQDEGGAPQSDPSKYGNCEIYTHCAIEPETLADCDKYVDMAIKNDCFIKIAEKTGDSSICLKVTVPDRRDKCYVKTAETTRDSKLCENIVDEDIKKHCYDSVAGESPSSPERERIGPVKAEEIAGEIVFTEDFEQGLENWYSYSASDAMPATGWDTMTEENGNTVLRGTDHNWIDLKEREWTNYIFKARFKIISGRMHFNYRLHKEGDFRRYYVGVNRDGEIYLTRSTPPTHINLINNKVPLQLDDGWHEFKMVGYNNILNIYIDDKLLIEYQDVGTPALPGGIAFETLGGGEFLIDDIEIQISGKKDVIGGGN
ncbi:MAG: hypothetical protein KJ955_07730 [Nanoarchaeota archaeon]|nr:hypothetical protein [Nanoarchaeota archaeon]